MFKRPLKTSTKLVAALIVIAGSVLAWYLLSPLIFDRAVNEPFLETTTDSKSVAVLNGTFKDADDFHKGSGKATLYKLPDNSHILRFEDFKVTNGPDLHVFLSGHTNPTNNDEVKKVSLHLGSLKGNIGNQNYKIPAQTDLSLYKSVVIFCRPFEVVFSTASLN